MLKIKGILPPMITPFKENGEVDYDAYVYNVKKWAATGLSGLLVLGSNSETAFLSEEEKLTCVRLAAENANGKLIMVGSGMETASETIRLTNKCAGLGAQCALILPPNYYDAAMTTPALVEFFTEVAEGSKIPILIYNVPKFTHVVMKPELIATLSKHPNIIGMKDSSGDVPGFASYMRACKGQEFSMIVGTASALYPALCLGADGGILALANCNPNECVEVYDLYHAGKMQEACGLYQRIFPINTAVTGTYGIPGLKVACDLMGFKGGYPRKPLQRRSEEDKAAIKKILEAADVL